MRWYAEPYTLLAPPVAAPKKEGADRTTTATMTTATTTRATATATTTATATATAATATATATTTTQQRQQQQQRNNLNNNGNNTNDGNINGAGAVIHMPTHAHSPRPGGSGRTAIDPFVHPFDITIVCRSGYGVQGMPFRVWRSECASHCVFHAENNPELYTTVASTPSYTHAARGSAGESTAPTARGWGGWL